jgi:hypothetical protein
MAKQKPKRVNILVDRSFSVPRPRYNYLEDRTFTMPIRKSDSTLVRDSSIPLAPTQFND